MKSQIKFIVGNALLLALLDGFSLSAQSREEVRTAWRDGQFHVDVAGVIGRSDIVLGHPNKEAVEALPLGNGRLGVAVWSASGLTAQLNRSDTMPLRLSPGQVVVPGLAALTAAKDYAGRLDLYNGEFRESGAGMTVVAYVQPDTDTLIFDVTGAKPDQIQTAQLKLWAPRNPKAAVNGNIGLLSEAWKDDKSKYASGRPFGSLSAITADGRDVSASVTDPLTITVSFRPFADGHFSIRVASPRFDGTQDAQALAGASLSGILLASHRAWWNSFWSHAAMIKITSPDGTGEYMENLRNIDLFVTAAGNGDEFLGYHAGVADMIYSGRDGRSWDPASYWHFDMRQQIDANMGAGLTELNVPYFRLYRENLNNILSWTKLHMEGSSGACVPEILRFNGNGGMAVGKGEAVVVASCANDAENSFNAHTLSTGAEVSLWVWRQYLATNDRMFLAENYSIMAESARFLLAYQKPGSDGLLHTEPTNAHENQWDVVDSTNDLAAMRALFPATMEAAKILGKDAKLVEAMQVALTKLPDFPRVDPANPYTLLPPSADADGKDVISLSYRPAAKIHNIENIGLEPVWPYELIGQSSPMFELAKRTYEHRPNVCEGDWSFDPVQAARLGLGSEVRKTLIETTEKYQQYINGLARWAPSEQRQFFVEQIAVVADALQQALVQDYDGVIWIAPAVPSDWDFAGSVFVRGKSKVDVQVHHGVPTTVVIEAGTTEQLKLRNPWPQSVIEVLAGATGDKVETSGDARIITIPVKAGERYLIERRGESMASQAFAAVSGEPAKSAKMLNPEQIGLGTTWW